MTQATRDILNELCAAAYSASVLEGTPNQASREALLKMIKRLASAADLELAASSDTGSR